jgi:hypothetical protein
MVIGRGGWGEGGKYDNVRLCDLEGPDLFSFVWTVVTWCGGLFLFWTCNLVVFCNLIHHVTTRCCGPLGEPLQNYIYE